MPMISASDARDNLDGLRAAIASLKACLRNEVPNETAILRRAMARVEEMTTIRHNDEIERRRMKLIIEAELTIARRTPVPAPEFSHG